MDYDDYRNLRFRPSQALWWDQPTPFHVEFLHLGGRFTEPVTVFEATDTHLQQIPFVADFFDYSQTSLNSALVGALPGYSGLRVRYPLNQKGRPDDLIVFQGASYFRALGRHQAYGLSTRGLAIGMDSASESFPRFTSYWLKKPEESADSVTLYALLEGREVTGAYRFVVTPGGTTRVEVKARLFFRERAAEAGFAPLTSMFHFGENTLQKPNDWRPEVHDSDGLLIAADGGWVWRPLDNPVGVSTTRFKVTELKGFGLLQRDRSFSSYEDLEADYERRPSAWVVPEGSWGPGEVVLYTFQTRDETVDNMNAFWRPHQVPEVGKPYDLEYVIEWRMAEPNNATLTVLETRVGQRTLDHSATTFVIEFSAPEDFEAMEIEAYRAALDTGPNLQCDEPVLEYNEHEKAIRVFFHVKNPEASSQIQVFPLRLTLQREGKDISEVWNYDWTIPPQPVAAKAN